MLGVSEGSEVLNNKKKMLPVGWRGFREGGTQTFYTFNILRKIIKKQSFVNIFFYFSLAKISI